MVVAKDLGEKGRQRHQRRVDRVVGFAHLLMHDLGDDIGREDMREQKHRINDQSAEKTPELSDRVRSG